MDRELWKGNEAIAEAAIRAGCRFFFGYPITPQNEIPEYMARHLPEHGGCFLQTESEIAAVNMVYGAAGAGARVMTSSSSPGVSLKQEGISYMAGAELPGVILNAMRGGPGLGNIQAAQGDYFQATRGGGNGDYRTPVLAPDSVQEAVDLTMLAFDLADRYRTPVMLLIDGIIGQMMEDITWQRAVPTSAPEKDWATTGTGGHREPNVINSWRSTPAEMEVHNLKLQKKYQEISRQEVRYEESGIEDAEIVAVAYGTPARLVSAAIELLRNEGIKVGLFRPITLWPYPSARLREIADMDHVRGFLTVEMSLGQMIDDVYIAVNGKKPVEFFGKAGGIIPSPEEIAGKIKSIKGER